MYIIIIIIIIITGAGSRFDRQNDHENSTIRRHQARTGQSGICLRTSESVVAKILTWPLLLPSTSQSSLVDYIVATNVRGLSGGSRGGGRGRALLLGGREYSIQWHKKRTHFRCKQNWMLHYVKLN